MTDPTAALTALLTAGDAYKRIIAFADLLELVDDQRVAVWDGACGRAVPLVTFFRACLRDPNKQPAHTTDTCRWATAEDQMYGRYPLIDACTAGGGS